MNTSPRYAVITALCLLMPFAAPATAQTVVSNTTASGPLVKVSGVGQVSVAPDMASISLGVTQEAETAVAATDALSSAMRDVLARLDSTGIAPADVQTNGLRLDVRRVYNNDTGESRVTGYVAATAVTIAVRDLDQFGSVLDAVVGDGANQINGLSFDVQDRAPHLAAARTAAVKDAMAKAALYAEAAGAELGGVRFIDDTNSMGEGPAPMMRMAMDEVSAVPVAEGEITVSARVDMVLDLD